MNTSTPAHKQPSISQNEDTNPEQELHEKARRIPAWPAVGAWSAAEVRGMEGKEITLRGGPGAALG